MKPHGTNDTAPLACYRTLAYLLPIFAQENRLTVQVPSTYQEVSSILMQNAAGSDGKQG
jgi:hypothetical protein